MLHFGNCKCSRCYKLKFRSPTLYLVRFTTVVLLILSAACTASAQDGSKPVAICSTTQVADFARQIAGDRWDVKCVLLPGQDPHLYQTKPSDLQLVESADLCLANGWHLEGGDWMQNLAETANKPLITCVEGIQPLELQEGTVTVKDPHAWFTPANARIYILNILKGVISTDPANEAEYKARAELYLAQLRALDAWIKKQVNTIPTSRRVLVTSHDAFGYFCQRYKFESAAPAGWSTAAEVGGGVKPALRQKTIDSIRKSGVSAIFVETSVNPKLINQIAKEAGVKVGGKLYSDSMGRAGSAGETYVGMMRENVLKIVNGLK